MFSWDWERWEIIKTRWLTLSVCHSRRGRRRRRCWPQVHQVLRGVGPVSLQTRSSLAGLHQGWSELNQSNLSSRTVKTTLDERISTFMQRSKPSMGETPALLTRTSIFCWKNFSALVQTCSHWTLSVTSCSSNMQEFSPNLWERQVKGCLSDYHVMREPAGMPGRAQFRPPGFYPWGQLCPRPPELSC